MKNPVILRSYRGIWFGCAIRSQKVIDSKSMVLTVIWAASWQNQRNGMCAQQRLRSAWAWRKLGSLATHWAHSEDCSDLAGCPGWSESSLGAHSILLALSWGDSSCFHHQIQCLSLYNSLDVFSLTFSLALFVFLYIWAATWQKQQNECVPSEDSDQPGHPPSLIRVFTILMKKPWVLSYPLSAQRRLRSAWASTAKTLIPGWSESSLGAHSFCWFCHVVAHINNDVM